MHIFERNYIFDKSILWWCFGLVSVVGYCALFFSLEQFPLLDFANHSTRAFLISELVRGRGPIEVYTFSLYFQPYILGDLIFASIYSLLPFRVGALAYLVLLFLIWVVSVIIFARARGLEKERILCLFLLLPWLTTNYFFLSGFVNFILGSALGFFCIAIVEGARHVEIGLSFFYRVIIFTVLAVLCYMVHLGPIVILFAVIAGLALEWKIDGVNGWWRPLLFLLPLTFIACVHLKLGLLGGAVDDTWCYPTVFDKSKKLFSPFARYNFPVDGLICLIFGIPAVVLAMRTVIAVRRLIAIFCPLLSLLVLYIILPESMGPASDVDSRAMLFATVFGLVGLMQIMNSGDIRAPLLLGSCFICSFVNLAYLSAYLIPANLHLRDYVSLLDRVPPGEAVFTVSTRQETGRLHFSFHPPETAIVERGLIVPYLFTSNMAGDQLKYFTSLRWLYAPKQLSYINGEPIDWQRVMRGYRYVLIEKPYEPQRVAPTFKLISQNASGALLAHGTQ